MQANDRINRYLAPIVYKTLKANARNISLKRVHHYMLSIPITFNRYEKISSTLLKNKCRRRKLLNRDFKTKIRVTKGIIFHSDLVTQYTNQKFQELVSKKEMIHLYLVISDTLMIMFVLNLFTLSLRRKKSTIIIITISNLFVGNYLNLLNAGIIEKEFMNLFINNMTPYSIHEGSA